MGGLEDGLQYVSEGADEPRLCYADRGPRAGQPVVLLHSLGTSHRLWRTQMDELSADYRVLAPDSRGHGCSSWARSGDPAPLTVEDWVGDLDRVLDHAQVGRAALVGLSMGGIQALAYSAAYPDRVSALVLADTFAELDPATAQAKITALTRTALDQGMVALADAYVAETFTVSPLPPDAELVRTSIAGMDTRAYASSARACFGARLGDRLRAVTAPTLVLWGDRDIKAPRSLAERIARGVPGAVLREIPRAGHLANVENPAQFTRLVRDFLAGLSMPGRRKDTC